MVPYLARRTMRTRNCGSTMLRRSLVSLPIQMQGIARAWANMDGSTAALFPPESTGQRGGGVIRLREPSTARQKLKRWSCSGPTEQAGPRGLFYCCLDLWT